MITTSQILLMVVAIFPAQPDSPESSGNCGPHAVFNILQSLGLPAEVDELIAEIKPNSEDCSLWDLQRAFERRNILARAIELNDRFKPTGFNWAAIVTIDLGEDSNHFASVTPNLPDANGRETATLRMELGAGGAYIGEWSELKSRFFSNQILMISTDSNIEIESLFRYDHSRSFELFSYVFVGVGVYLSVRIRRRR